MLRAINGGNETLIIKNEKPQPTVTTSFRANDYERVPYNDTVEISSKKNSNKNLLIGLGAVAVAATLGIIGHKQGWFKKAVEEAKPTEATTEEIKKTFKELYDDAIKNKKESIKNEITGRTHSFEYNKDGKLIKETVTKGEDKAEYTLLGDKLRLTTLTKNGKTTTKTKSKIIKKTEKTLEEKIDALNEYLGENEKLSSMASESEIKSAYRRAAKRANAQNNEKALSEINTIYQDIQSGAKKGTQKQIAQFSEAGMLDDLAKEGKLNYELKIGGNKIVVKNGKFKKAINGNNQEWMITEKTDKEFVQKIDNAIKERNNKILAELKSAQAAEDGKAILEAQEKELRQMKALSDKRNEEWVKNQRAIKEKAYRDWWNQALLKQEYTASINAYAKQMKLNGEIFVDDRRIIFADGTLKKMISTEGKELTMNEATDNFIKKLHENIVQKYEKEIATPQAKAEIERLTSIYKEYRQKVANVIEELEAKGLNKVKWNETEGSLKETIIKKDGEKYRIRYNESLDEFYDIQIKKGDEIIKLGADNEGIIMQVGDKSCKFNIIEGTNELKFTEMYTSPENLKPGEIYYLSNPYYNSSNHWRINYYMPDQKFGGRENFYTDFGDYYSKKYLNA